MRKIIVALVIVLALTMFVSCSDSTELESVIAQFTALETEVKAGNAIGDSLATLAANLVNVDSLVTGNSAGTKIGITFDIYKSTKHVYGQGGGLHLALSNAKNSITKISSADIYTYDFSPYRVEMILVYGE